MENIYCTTVPGLLNPFKKDSSSSSPPPPMSTSIQHVYIHLICDFEHKNSTVQPHQSSLLLRKINRTFFFYEHQNPGLPEAKCNFLSWKILKNLADRAPFIIIFSTQKPKRYYNCFSISAIENCKKKLEKKLLLKYLGR